MCDQKVGVFCLKEKTNDALVDMHGTHEIICITGLPFPFVAFHDMNGNFRQYTRLHAVQEAMAVCTACSWQQPLRPRTKDLGGFLFHLAFNESMIYHTPRRVCLGRYVADYCRIRKCQKAKCQPCKDNGTCAHHGHLEDFREYEGNERSMAPFLRKHSQFLQEADRRPRQVRVILMPFATPPPPLPLPEPEPQQPGPVLGPSSSCTASSANALSNSAHNSAPCATGFTPSPPCPASTTAQLSRPAYLTPVSPPGLESTTAPLQSTGHTSDPGVCGSTIATHPFPHSF